MQEMMEPGAYATHGPQLAIVIEIPSLCPGDAPHALIFLVLESCALRSMANPFDIPYYWCRWFAPNIMCTTS